jgi:sulfate adenylyltransferase
LPKSHRGITVFFTGLSAAGKTTIANELQRQLVKTFDRPVTLLDGDDIRKHLTSDLGFSRQHRDQNIKRIAGVAREVTAAGGIAICAVIAPYDEARRGARLDIEAVGRFLLVHVATPLDECERRDPKGLYAKARAGLVTQFTGISDPYEVPQDAEVVINTTQTSAEEAARLIVGRLVALNDLHCH